VAHASALDGADVHEHILAAIARLNEAKALLRIEPLDGAGSHFCSPKQANFLLGHDCPNNPNFSFVLEREPRTKWSAGALTSRGHYTNRHLYNQKSDENKERPGDRPLWARDFGPKRAYSTISATALPHAVVSALPPRSLVRSVRSP